MTQESLNIAVDLIIDVISKSKINPTDKCELLLNLNHLLENKEKYDAYLKILQKTDNENNLYR